MIAITRSRTLRAMLASATAILLLAGCAAAGPARPAPSGGAPSAGSAGTFDDPALVDGSGAPASTGLAAGIRGLAQRSPGAMPARRLAPGLVPPTNKWFSGLVFGTQPQPVFPLPLSFALTADGFAFGKPAVTTSADTITGAFLPAVTVGVGARRQLVTGYDDASVTIAQQDPSGRMIGSTTIAEGSPVVGFTAARATTLTLAQPFAADGTGLYTARIAGADYGLVTKGHVAGSSLRLAAGQTASWFVAPAGVAPRTLASKVSPVRSVALAYRVGSRTASTSLRYRSAGPTTLIAAMPHQRAGLTSPASCALGHYATVYGTMSLCAGGTLSWTVPRTAPDDALQLGGLAAAQKAQLRTQLGRDIAATKPVPADSYYGGKALYRMANLLQLARGLDDRAAAARVSTMLDRALLRWTAPGGCTSGRTQCFVYDPHARGVVGLTPSFGSELFNDHYFHYGYFLYAAAVAVGGSGSGSGAGSGASGSGASGSGADVGSAGATALRARLAPVVNLLAADIASPTPSTVLPVRRVFDAYAGHAWASGYAPFADGNNQESTSEAVGAWNGLALWAAATGNGTLRDEAEWMLSAESQNARLYGLGFDTAQPVYRGFAHSIVSLSWGGKRDYGTWFSADPSAKLGIQLIPMSPVSRYLVAGAGAGAGAGAASPSGAGDASVSAAARARVVRNIAGVPSRFRGPLGDYILMYSALGRAASASSLAEAARALPGATIDDADSRSYLLAYVLTAGR